MVATEVIEALIAQDGSYAVTLLRECGHTEWSSTMQERLLCRLTDDGVYAGGEVHIAHIVQMKEFARQYLIRNLLLARVLDIVYTVLCRATKVSIVAQGILSHLGAHLGIGRTDVFWCGTKGIHHPLAKETPALGISVPYP